MGGHEGVPLLPTGAAGVPLCALWFPTCEIIAMSILA